MQQQIDLTNIKVLTFDCYGTLIDWETGISEALTLLLAKHDLTINAKSLLQMYATHELAERNKPYQSYKTLLRNVVSSIFAEFKLAASSDEQDFLPYSIKNWPPFTDTVKSLNFLHQKYKLGVISNIDNDLFEISHSKMPIHFSWIVTAEQAQSYKPNLDPFTLALEKIPYPKENILHIAESNYHDIAPAKHLGIKSVWVRRQEISNATLKSSINPDIEVSDLACLCNLL